MDLLQLAFGDDVLLFAVGLNEPRPNFRLVFWESPYHPPEPSGILMHNVLFIVEGIFILEVVFEYFIELQ